MPRRFRSDEPEEGQPSGPFQPIQMPTNLNLLVYPRQSAQAQVLHHATSTEMQTADLVEIGVRYGWSPEKCIINDDGLGVSATLDIDERVGLALAEVGFLRVRIGVSSGCARSVAVEISSIVIAAAIVRSVILSDRVAPGTRLQNRACHFHGTRLLS